MRLHHVLATSLLSVLGTSDLHAFQQRAEACDSYEAAVRADPSDLAAAVRLGQCSVRDYEMIALDGDSSRMVFRTNWTPALRALRHAVAVDPGFERAYRPLFRILLAETRDGCSSVTWECRHVAPVLRIGDSIRTVPVLVDSRSADPYGEVIAQSRSTWRASLLEARDLASRWAAVAPRDARPYEYLARALLKLGDPRAATVEFERAAAMGTPASRRALFRDRVEALIQSDMGDEARRVIDEAMNDAGRDTTRLFARRLDALNAIVGRHRPGDVPPPMSQPSTFDEMLARGDTAAARRLLAQQDSNIAPVVGVWRIPKIGEDHLASAEMHLALGDTLTALSRFAEIDRGLYDRHGYFAELDVYSGRPWLGRAWLLAGQVFAARGRHEDAQRMFQRVIGLWGGGDAVLQPIVARARAESVP